MYKIECSDCNKFYISPTGCSFSQRYKEHINALNNKTDFRFANHVINTGHTYTNIDNMNILHYCKKGYKLYTLQQFEIYKCIKLHDTRHLKRTNKFQISQTDTEIPSIPHVLLLFNEFISVYFSSRGLSKYHRSTYSFSCCVIF